MAGKSLNKVQLIGNLGKDPELRYTQNGTAVATLTLATNEREKVGEQWQDRTEWHRIVLWGRQAEVAGEYLNKGSKCYIEGRLQTRKWTDNQNVERYTTEVVGHDLILLGGRGESSGGGGRLSAASGRYDGSPGFYRPKPGDKPPAGSADPYRIISSSEHSQ